MGRLFERSVYLKITFLKSLTTIMIIHLREMRDESSNALPFLLRCNRNCLEGVDYQVVPIYLIKI